MKRKSPAEHPELELPGSRPLWKTGSGLFSDHYLKQHIARNSWWPKDDETLRAVWTACREIYQKRARWLAEKGNEQDCRQEFIDKVLTKLGFAWSDNLRLPSTSQDLEPDYILYASDAEKEKVLEQDRSARYAAGVSLLEAKKFGHPLAQISKHQQRYPHQQIRDYLAESQIVGWGILTNGREWRLYCRDTKASEFFEISFSAAIETPENFRYFVALFGPAAFIRDSSGKCRLDQLRASATATQAQLEADLRERIFGIVECLANGFAERPENNITDADLKLLYQNCLIYLYRLLFILYAEGRHLLPVDPPNRRYYKQLSLRRLLPALKNFSEFDSRTQTRLCRDIRDLCHVINGADARANKEFDVPRYNGGLFDPLKRPELERWEISDVALANVLRQLMFTPDKSSQKFLPLEAVDYSELSVQQLGSIYEGLLEHHFARKPDGRLGLLNDKAERKATGTYYTPDYIVKYIVEHTLGPLVAELEARDPVKAARAANRKDNSFAQEMLKLNICDPAMGSGHFLVEATIWLAEQIVYHPTTQLGAQVKGDETREEAELAHWRRRAVEACIYGVDLNPLAVELAKLSLWLTTIASDQPLNFLDHHLRCGNSLIGARLDQLGHLPAKKKVGPRPPGAAEQTTISFGPDLKQAVAAAIREMAAIEAKASADVDDVKNKEKVWAEKILPMLQPYKTVADLWTSTFFGNKLDEETYVDTARKILATIPKVGKNTRTEIQPSEAAFADRRFFHWELEFPEVFFDEQGEHARNPGFDAVVANPPYDILKRSDDAQATSQIDYLRANADFTPALGRTFNLYRPFLVLAELLDKRDGRIGMIMPLSVVNDLSSSALRKYLFSCCQITGIDAFPQKDDLNNRVFREAKLSTCILSMLTGKAAEEIQVRIHPGKDIVKNSPEITFDIEELKKFDPLSWSIPIVTEQRWRVCKKIYAQKNIGHFADVVECLVGEIDLTLCRLCITKNPTDSEMLKGTQVYPYFTTTEMKQGEREWINLAKFNELFASGSKVKDRGNPRLAMQGVTGTDDNRRLKATVLEPGPFLGNSVNYIRLKPNVPHSLFFFCALLNSNLLEWRFRLTSGNNNVNNYEIEILPLPEIKFSTIAPTRKLLLTKGYTLCEAGTSDSDRARVVDFAQEQLDAERTDVIHDLLAFLAERMMTLNAEKNADARKFLGDLNDFHGVEAHSLKPKTKLDEFWKLATADLFAHLHANAKLLAAQNVRLKDADDEKIRERFQKAKDQIVPLETALASTDALIDQIVYRLYGLTPEEIRLVEGTGTKVADLGKCLTGQVDNVADVLTVAEGKNFKS